MLYELWNHLVDRAKHSLKCNGANFYFRNRQTVSKPVNRFQTTFKSRSLALHCSWILNSNFRPGRRDICGDHNSTLHRCRQHLELVIERLIIMPSTVFWYMTPCMWQKVAVFRHEVHGVGNLFQIT